MGLTEEATPLPRHSHEEAAPFSKARSASWLLGPSTPSTLGLWNPLGMFLSLPCASSCAMLCAPSSVST